MCGVWYYIQLCHHSLGWPCWSWWGLCDGSEQHQWSCFALSGQDYPSLRPALLTQMSSHGICPPSQGGAENNCAWGSWHPSTRVSPFILILASPGRVWSQSRRKGKLHAMALGHRPGSSSYHLDGSCTRRWPPQWPWPWEWSHSCRRAWGNGCCQRQRISAEERAGEVG